LQRQQASSSSLSSPSLLEDDSLKMKVAIDIFCEIIEQHEIGMMTRVHRADTNDSSNLA
jgi:hypothetical protein